MLGNMFLYTGRQFDEETGLYYYRARYYSPTLGRFLQTDPVGDKDHPNLYQYALWDAISSLQPLDFLGFVALGPPPQTD